MAGRWIDKRQAFEVKDALRTDKVVAHFTDDGVYKVSQDAMTIQTIPLADVVDLPNSGVPFVILPKHNGTRFILSRASGGGFQLPRAALGRMTVHITSYLAAPATQTTPHTLFPKATDYIKANGLAALPVGTPIKFGKATGAELQSDSLTLASNGIDTWYITAASTVLGQVV